MKEQLWLTLYASAKNEINNTVSENGKEIFITLADGNRAKVWVEEITEPKIWKKSQNNYVKKHEFWPDNIEIATAPITPLTLRNYDDLKAYIEDILECNYETFHKTGILELDGRYFDIFIENVRY